MSEEQVEYAIFAKGTFFDPSMDKAEFEIIKVSPTDRSDGGVFF